MFTRLVIPKGATVLREEPRVTIAHAEQAPDELTPDEAALFRAIFPPGLYEFPNGLTIPKLRSVSMQLRRGVTVIR